MKIKTLYIITLVFILLFTNSYSSDGSIETNVSNETYDLYHIFLLAYFIMMLITMFKGYGENRRIIIFRDYNDLGLTFLIPASFILIYVFFTSVGGNLQLGGILAFIVALILFSILVKNTYADNRGSLLYAIMAILTKMPLGIIWIINLITMLNPSGNTVSKRRKSRGSALVILALLTPIVTMLVAEKEGSLFNPKDWIKGKGIGSIRDHF